MSSKRPHVRVIILNLIVLKVIKSKRWHIVGGLGVIREMSSKEKMGEGVQETAQSVKCLAKADLIPRTQFLKQVGCGGHIPVSPVLYR